MEPSSIVQLGAAIWREVKPWRRVKKWRNKRRARKGRPLLPITEEDDKMFPQGTMTHTGSGIAASGPVIMFVLKMIGVGECTPDSLAMGCIGAAEIAGALITLGGAALAIAGRIRAARSARTPGPATGG